MGERESGRLFFLTLLLALSPILPFSLSLLAAAPAQGQAVCAVVSADSVLIGERFRLTLVARYEAAATARFPSAADSAAFGDLVVIERQSVSGAIRPDGARIDSVTYEVTTFALSTARVPPLAVQLISEEGDTTTVRTEALRVPVRSTVPPEAAELRPPTPPASFPHPLWPWLLGGAAVLALLMFLGYRWWHRTGRDAPAAAERKAERRPPYEAAARRLSRLDPETTDAEEIKAFYTELSDALRTYLHRRLGTAAREQTTGELLRTLRRRARAGRLSGEAVRRVQAALAQADLVKFADRRPAPKANAQTLAEARAALEAVEAR